MKFICCNVNDDSYNIVSDFDDNVIVDYYGIKMLVTIGDIWKRLRSGGDR